MNLILAREIFSCEGYLLGHYIFEEKPMVRL